MAATGKQPTDTASASMPLLALALAALALGGTLGAWFTGRSQRAQLDALRERLSQLEQRAQGIESVTAPSRAERESSTALLARQLQVLRNERDGALAGYVRADALASMATRGDLAAWAAEVKALQALVPTVKAQLQAIEEVGVRISACEQRLLEGTSTLAQLEQRIELRLEHEVQARVALEAAWTTRLARARAELVTAAELAAALEPLATRQALDAGLARRIDGPALGEALAAQGKMLRSEWQDAMRTHVDYATLMATITPLATAKQLAEATADQLKHHELAIALSQVPTRLELAQQVGKLATQDALAELRHEQQDGVAAVSRLEQRVELALQASASQEQLKQLTEACTRFRGEQGEALARVASRLAELELRLTPERSLAQQVEQLQRRLDALLRQEVLQPVAAEPTSSR